MSEILQHHQQFCYQARHLRNLSERTIEGYEDSMRSYLKFSSIQFFLEFKRQSIIDWIIHGRTGLKWKPKTAHIYTGNLKAFADWCVYERLLASNPAADIPLPKIPYKEPEFFTQKELNELLDHVWQYPYETEEERNRALAIFTMFIMAGLRKSELLNLRYNDVNLEGGYLYVRQGKGRRDRVVRFNPGFAASFHNYLLDRRKLKRTCPYFFVSTCHDAPLNETALRRLVEKINRTFYLKVYMHKLRHSFATHIMNNGVEKHKASGLLGHANPSSTNVYTHVCDDSLQDQIAAHGYHYCPAIGSRTCTKRRVA